MPGSRPGPVTPPPARPGTVSVQLELAHPLPEVWSAISDPDRLRRWFATCVGELRPGAPIRFDFDDGDFFAVRLVRLDPPHVMEFDWRFLGVGPVDRIRLELRAAGGATLLTVHDRESDRDAATCAVLEEGWRDFTGRLARHLDTGAVTRYPWRGEIDGWADAPAGLDPLGGLDRLYRWLPVASDGFAPRWFFAADDAGPRRFEIGGWRLDAGRLDFRVAIPGAAAETVAAVTARRAGDAVRIAFTHTGWRELGLADETALALRRRFARAWTAALERVAVPSTGVRCEEG